MNADSCATGRCTLETSPRQKFPCPACGHTGRAVGLSTVRSLAKQAVPISADVYRFCTTPDCLVVYFDAEGGRIDKPQVRVRVGLKETEDPIPVCYCFGFTRADIVNDLRTLGMTRIPDKIRAEVKADNCACEANNPSGSCCLGDVSRVVKQRLQSLKASVTM